ncbi:MAG: hypothetical protein ACI9IP_000012 [Arcticibacterium sp.]
MKKALKIILALVILLGVTVYFYGFEKIGRQYTALKSENKEYKNGDWKEMYAYELGKQAFIYGFPAVYYANVRYRFIEKPEGPISMNVNELFANRMPALPENKFGGSPNRDTPYSLAFLDLTDNAAVFTMPKNPDARYYNLQCSDFYSDVYGYATQLSDDDISGDYLIVGPTYSGDTTGYKAVLRSPTNWSFIIARTFTDATEEDLKICHAIQDNYKLRMLKEDGATRRDVLNPLDGQADPLNALKTMNAVMRESPPLKRDEALMNLYAQVGLGSKGTMDLDTLDESIKKGLRRAVVDAMGLMQNASQKYGSIGNHSKTVNQWVWAPTNWGRMAETSDFFGRAATQCMVGIVEHWVEEATKLRAFNDVNGDALNGSNNYKIHFEKENIPNPKAFWSITAYNDKYNLMDNAAEIWCLGDYTKTMKYNSDGSLDVYLQAEKPEGELALNWIPTLKGDDFNLFFRAYLPEQNWIDQSYIAPGVEKNKLN